MSPEQAVEKFMRSWLVKTKFCNKVYAVGGYVRDELMGLEPKDLDIVVELNGGSEELTEAIYNLVGDGDLISRPRQMGASYPIWQLTFKGDITIDGLGYFPTSGAVIEFADTMTESYPDSSSRQREVHFASLKEDIERRDFTINMGLKDLSSGGYRLLTDNSGRVINYMEDIKRRVLRGHPNNPTMDKVFSSDPLRLLRMIRFSAKYNMIIPVGMRDSAIRVASRLGIISKERIREELIKILNLTYTDDNGVSRGKTAQAIEMMAETGLLVEILPEVQRLSLVEQSGPYHLEGDVLLHTLMVLRESKPGYINQMSALLHDVGKYEKKEVKDSGQITFLNHDLAGKDLVKDIMERLKFPAKEIKDMCLMVEYHNRPYQIMGSHKSKRKLKILEFIDEVGKDLINPIIDLAEADGLGKVPVNTDGIAELRSLVEEVYQIPFEVNNPPFTGSEIVSELGAKGPMVGRLKEFLLKRSRSIWLSEGRLISREESLKELKIFYKYHNR